MSMAFDKAPFNEDSLMEDEFIRLRDKYKISTVVETGTYYGVTTSWLAKNFEKVYTTEINELFYNNAIKRFNDENIRQNIKSYLSNSVEVLPKIIEEIKLSGEKCLFFLDAHWYANPLLGELGCISSCGFKPTVLCIHDMMNPNDLTMGYDVYLEQGITYTFEWVKPYIETIYGAEGYTHYFNEGAYGARRGALFVVNNADNTTN